MDKVTRKLILESILRLKKFRNDLPRLGKLETRMCLVA